MKSIPEAIAWTLLHFCWEAAAIAVLYRIASLAVARRTSQTRYLVALVAMMLMLGAALATFAAELEAHPVGQASVHPEALTGHAASSAEAAPTFAPAWIARGIEVKPAARLNLLRWVDGLWLLGVCAFSLRSLGGWWLLERLCREAGREVPAELTASFSRIAAALGIRRAVLLRISGRIAGPATVGTLRAMVLLPVSAVTLLSREELEMVLAHELAHVRRADFLWNLLQTFIETLFFFHPAVWWLGRCISRERELCCDDLALKVCPNPLVYASALFRLEEQRSRQWRLAMALDGHQSGQSLRIRIARILGEPQARVGGRAARPVSLPLAVLALLVALISAPQFLVGLRPAAPVLKTSPFSLRAASLATQPVSRPVLAKLGHASVRQAAMLAVEPAVQEKQAEASEPARTTGTTYIDQMRAAGYDVDLDKLIAMKIQGVTPDYARAMGQAGFGKLSADDLVACKVQGVTPEFLAGLKEKGLVAKSVHEAISYKIFEVTPEFVAGMKDAGFTGLSSEELVKLRVQGVTPEYARQIAQQFPGASADDVVKTRIFGIDGEFIARAKKYGFNDLSLEKLVKLRISGVLDDEAVKP